MSPTRIAQFRLSLLVSLGIVPVACGGTTQDSGNVGEPVAGTGGTSSVAGSSSESGSTSKAGKSSMAGESGSGGQPVQVVPCTSPVTDPVTGLVSCEEGYVHRPTALTCMVGLAKAAPGARLPRADGSVSCTDDASVCGAFDYGYCQTFEDRPELSVCQSGCAVDQDCGPMALCACGDAQSPTGGVCRPSTCATDAECEPGYSCADYSSECDGAFPTPPEALPFDLACQTSRDECASDADCEGSSGGNLCQVREGRRVCGSVNPACGRPFLVDAQPRLAPTVNSRAWANTAALSPRVAELSAAERAAHAAHWTNLGRMEHASIAAFARFSLQLLSLGAPPELVDACTQALADETAHTKLCFQLASAYAGHAIGPGPLDVRGSLEASSLSDIVDLVIVEGCFGETRAALEALAAADAASDPAIQAAYAQIAADEQRHAELAFRFVRWALTQNESAVRERIGAALASDLATDAVARGVTAPCLQALLATAT